jgi:hypothetical protein
VTAVTCWRAVAICTVMAGAVGIPQLASADNSERAMGIYCDPTHDTIEVGFYLAQIIGIHGIQLRWLTLQYSLAQKIRSRRNAAHARGRSC